MTLNSSSIRNELVHSMTVMLLTIWSKIVAILSHNFTAPVFGLGPADGLIYGRLMIHFINITVFNSVNTFTTHLSESISDYL